MSATLSFTVPGVPQTKGSAKAFVPKSWAAAALAKGKQPRAVITNDNPRAKAWQQQISEAASTALEHSNLQPLAEGPVMLDVWLYFPRPQKFLTKKYAAIDVPHTTRPDADKSLRVVKDSLSRVVYRDDGQVVDAYVHKRYCRPGEQPRAEITIRAVTTDLPKPIRHPETPTLFGEETCYGEATTR